MSTTGFFLLKLTVTGVLLAILFSVVDVRQVGSYVTEVSWQALFMAALCYLAATFLSVVRWSLLLRAQGVRVPTARLMSYNLSYTFYSIVLPAGKVAAEAVRVVQIVNDTNDPEARGKVAVSTLVDRALVVCSCAAVAILFFITGSGREVLETLPAWLPYAAAAAILLIVLVALLPLDALPGLIKGRSHNKVGSALSSISEALKSFKSKPLVLLVAVALTIAMLAFITLGILILASSLGFMLPFILTFEIFSTSMVAAFIPLSIGGVGFREGTFAYLLTGAAVAPLEVAITISLLALIASHAVTLMGGAVEFHRHFLRKKT